MKFQSQWIQPVVQAVYSAEYQVNLLAAWNWLLELEQPVQVLQKDLQMVQFDA